MATIADGSKIGENLILQLWGRGESRSCGSSLNMLEARAATIVPLDGHVKDNRILFLNQWYKGLQGIPSSSPQVQVADFAAAELHSRPILGRNNRGNGRREETLGLAML